MKKYSNKHLAYALLDARKRVCATVDEVAMATGISAQRICYYECGAKAPSVLSLAKLLDYFKQRGLNLTMDEMIGRTA